MRFFHMDSPEQHTQTGAMEQEFEEQHRRQFDFGMMAEEAARAGRVQEADDLYRMAFTIPDEDNDSSWLIGSYCSFLRAHCRTDEAFALLKGATDGGTDLPYLWDQLINILADRRDVDGIMDLVRKVPAKVVPHDQLAAWLVRYANEQNENLEFSEQLARRAREFARVMGDTPGEWLITGRLGHIIEKLGRVDEATNEWSEAFEAGSSDSTTAIRLSMALDKAKRYDEARSMIQVALTRGLPASSEENLKERLAKLQARQSPTKERKDVTAFSIRFDDGFLKLRYQVRLKPTLKKVTVLSGTIHAHCAAKDVNEAVRINLQNGEEIGRVPWPDVQFHHSAPDGWGLGQKNPPRVGSGSAQLFFLNPDDSVIATKEVPDSTSGVAHGSGQWYVGCRDGRLYCFDRQGNLKWRWVTPGAEDPFDSVYSRPCPYYVTATDVFVTFSSWGNLFALSNSGELLWQRDVPNQGPITITIPRGGSFNLDSWKVLGLSQGATDTDIKRAYRKLALDNHPDRNPDDLESSEHFRIIQSAYESLMAAPHLVGDIDSVTFTMTMLVTVSRLIALDDEIVVVSSDGVIAFLDRSGEMKSRRVLGRSAVLPVFDASGVLRVTYCDEILSFFDGESVVNATAIEKYPDSISLWGDEVIVADRTKLTLYSRLGVKLWSVEFSKRLTSFSAEGRLLVCSAGALIVFERVT